MGNEYSLASLPSNVVAQFDVEKIKRLSKSFRKLDVNKSQTLSADELMAVPGLQANPLVQRVIDIFDTNGNKEIDFVEFLEGISHFSEAGDTERKLKFVFKMYDIDQDGFITNGELFTVLKLMVADNLGDVQLQQIVDKTIQRFDKDGDGKISYQEFCEGFGDMDVYKKMVVPV